MSTTLLAAEQELSKQIGDYWAGTATSAGAAGGTTIIDTALKAKQNDWITKETYDFLTSEPASTAAIYEERLISSLDNSTGTITVLAHGTGGTGIVTTGDTYEIHRLFFPSEKRRALISAARQSYPHIFKEIRDESLVSGNWLKDGSFEIWTSSSALTYWTTTTTTLTQTSTAYYFKHGSYSAKLSTVAGNIKQSVTNYDDLKRLAGHEVTFTLQGHCDTASCLRIGIYDGTTYTYSSYHAGDSAWTEDNDPLTVTATIKDNPTAIQFIVYHAVAAGVSYVDDARVIGPENGKVYIGGLGLGQNKPHQVQIENTDYSYGELWRLIRDIQYDSTNGYMYLPISVPADRRIRVLGTGYLDFLASGVSSTAWTATIAVDSPQTDILVAQAALYLYTEMSMPNFTQGTREKYQEMIGFWKQELRERIGRFGMESPSSTVSYQ